MDGRARARPFAYDPRVRKAAEIRGFRGNSAWLRTVFLPKLRRTG